MVWIFGNSSERISLKDLNDVVYFRQKKQYTDQEFASSKDLQREIKAGRIIKLEHSPDIRAALPDNMVVQQTTVTPKFDTQEIRRAVAEALGDQKPQAQLDIKEVLQAVTDIVKEHKAESIDIPSLVTSLIPIISETVRQEIAKMPSQTVYVQPGHQQIASSSQSKFQDLAYVPDISSEGMKSSISIKDKTVEGSSVSGGLEALKKLKSG